jgi:hypothetical protein
MQAIQLGIAHVSSNLRRAAICVMIVQLACLFPKKTTARKNAKVPGTKRFVTPPTLK